MTEPEQNQEGKNERDRVRRRSRSPQRRDKNGEDERRKGDRYRPHSRSRSRSPPRRHGKHSRSISPTGRKHRSRSRSPRHRRDRDVSRERRSRSRSRLRHRKRRRSHSVSSSSSESSGNDKLRKRKDRHNLRKDRSRSRSRDRKGKAKEKKAKKDKKKKKKDKGAVPEAQWGKYGIIGEADMYDKDAEFRTWLVEERIVNPETMSKDQTKKEFARFVEDYNTATLPHEKFYNMTSYEARMSSMRHGDTLPIVDSYDPNADLLAHSNAHKRAAKETDTYLSKEELEELRKVQQQRHQVAKMKLMGMEIKQSFGVRMDGNQFEE